MVVACSLPCIHSAFVFYKKNRSQNQGAEEEEAEEEEEEEEEGENEEVTWRSSATSTDRRTLQDLPPAYAPDVDS